MKHAQIVFKLHNQGTKYQCGFCECIDRADVPLAAFIEGSDILVCSDCVDELTGIPGLSRLLAKFSAEIDLLQEVQREHRCKLLNEVGGRC